MKKTLSIIMALLLLISVLPMSAFAAGTEMTDTAADTDTTPAAADVEIADEGATIVDSVRVTVNVPYPGNHYSTSYRASTSGYTVSDIRWFKPAPSGGGTVPMTASDTFQAGEQYVVFMCITASGGYTLAAGDSTTSTVSAVINGYNADKYTYDGTPVSTKIAIQLHFPTVSYLTCSSIALTNVPTSLTAGTAPSYTAPTVSSAGGHFAHAYSDYEYGYKNGVCWYDITAGKYIDPSVSYTFIVGHTYRAYYMFSVDENYQFADTVTATVNGSSATVTDPGINSKYWRYVRTPDIYAAGTVTNIAVTGIDAPAAGNTPDYTATSSNSLYYIESYNSGTTWKNGVMWYNVTDNKSMNTTDTFEAGKQYRITVSMKPKTGYTFASSLTGTVNGNSTTDFYRYSSQNVGIRYTFTAPYGIIGVSVTGVTAPVEGKTPAYTFTLPTGANYESDNDSTSINWKNGVQWYNVTDGTSMAQTDRFVAGKKYRVCIGLNAKSGYNFYPSASMTGKVNGYNTSDFVEYGSSHTHIGIRYTFTAASTVTINSVEVNGITAPLPGEKPVYSAAVPSGKGYQVETSWNYQTSVKNGVFWYNVTDGVDVNDIDTFVAGKQYRVRVSLIPTSDVYVFNGYSTTAALNGNNASVHVWDTDNIGVDYTFTCRPAVSLNYFEATIAAPVAGQPLSYDATVPSDQGYMVEDYNGTTFKNGVRWSEDGSYLSASADNKAVAGKTYTVEISLVPTDNRYTFLDSGLSGKVNGNTADAGRYAANNNYLKYSFTVSDASTTSVTVDVTSYLDANENVTVDLVQNNSTKYTKSIKGTISSSAPVMFTGVAEGIYTIRVSKKDHVTREYIDIYLFGSANVFYAQICPIGDANLNGTVQATDAMLAYRCATNQYTFTDDYAKKCADANGNGTVQATDAMMIYRQSTGKHTLF